MSGSHFGNWHNANGGGGGLPFRPPTVDEALPYSPFTSIVPFSPDIIPFPSTEPPTPPNTLTSEQQNAARKSVDLLNDEISRASTVSLTLQHTLHELQSLLNPDELPEFKFKPVTQLATPPPEGPNSTQTNGSTPARVRLSPFAEMLLKSSDVSYVLPGLSSPRDHKQSRIPAKQQPPQVSSRPAPRPQAAGANHAPYVQNSALDYQQHNPPSIPSIPTATPPLPHGPVVLIKQLPPTAPRDEYQRFEALKSSDNLQKKDLQSDYGTVPVKSREREILEFKIQELDSVIDELIEEKETEDSGFFSLFDTDDGQIMVLSSTALFRLSEAVSKVVNFGGLSSVPVNRILLIQSLCEPLVTATSQLDLNLETTDDDQLLATIARAQLGLKSCKLILQTMTESHDDRRICSDDRVQGIVRLLKHILSSIIIPMSEARRAGSSAELFTSAMKHKSTIYSILRLCGTALAQVATLIAKIRLSDFTLNPLESICMDIIFAQTGEKEAESALGIQKFESFRQRAMDVVAQIFAGHLDHRDSVTVDILNNLDKLPDKRASARQFKSAREAPIMLVSALFMRIVQAAASSSSEKAAFSAQKHTSESEDEEDEESDVQPQHAQPKKWKTSGKDETPEQIVKRLSNDARNTARTIAGHLVARAENVSKSGDKPYRNILDLFIEDLCNVLGSPEWPAASVILEQMFLFMCSYSQNHKEKGVQAADMAIASLGSMGVGIIDFKNRLRHLKRGLDISQSGVASKLVHLAEDALSESININDVLNPTGPYGVVLESLPGYINPQASQANRDDPRLQTLTGHYLTFWADSFYQTLKDSNVETTYDDTLNPDKKFLDRAIIDPKWLSKEYNFQDVTETESQLAAGIIALQEKFCKYLQTLIQALLRNTQSNSAKVKSRGMSSLTQMIEKDPQILDEKTFSHLALLTKDASPLVRGDTVSLISTCLERNPALEEHCLPAILALMNDDANGPKKKAMKLLRDIYLATTSKDKKVKIATELLLPISDDDKSVADMARQTLEDIWLGPLRSTSKVDDSQLKLNRETRVSLLVETVRNIQLRPRHLQAFEAFFTAVVSTAAKNSSENLKICKDMVADMVERVIGADPTSGERAQAFMLQTLSIFAKVNARLFTTDHIQLLKLYLKKPTTNEEIDALASTAMIFRFVLPALPPLQEPFLEEIRSALPPTTNLMATNAAAGDARFKNILENIAHCSWIVALMLKGDPPNVKSGMEKLAQMMGSVATQLEPLSLPKQMTPNNETRIKAYILLLGTFGKVCDFDAHVDVFRRIFSKYVQQLITTKKLQAEQVKRIKEWNGPSVAVLFLDLILPFTRQAWAIDVRERALCSIGEVCQQKTKYFTRADIEKVFKLPFINQDAALVRVVLTQFREFFAAAERRSEGGGDNVVGEGTGRLETSFTASDNDHATTHIARSFLSDISNIALGKADEVALIATQIIVSISRQGLLHPKECGAALVALSTSRIREISLAASQEHEKIHRQHESMFEKEYVAAVSLAFKYQRDVFQDPRGVSDSIFKPKMQLLFDAFKKGSRKTSKTFATNLFKQLDFELPDLDTAGGIPDAVLFARFCLENFAFFDYARIDEVMHVILTIEGIVLKQTGPSVALAIETELPGQQLEDPPREPPAGYPSDVVIPADVNEGKITNERLRHLTAATLILHMMWETRIFLRRAYNLQDKLTPKDLLKPAVRINFITGKDLWERFTLIINALDSPEAMRKQCSEFGEIINVDREHRAEEEDIDATEQLARAAAGYETPDEDDGGNSAQPGSGRGRKRKTTAQVGNTPKKARGRLSGSRNKKRTSRTPEDSD